MLWTPPLPDHLQSARILLVEDNALLAAELGDRLTGLGYVVVGQAASAAAALDEALRTTPDLILMDIRLRGPEDGIAAARAIGDRLDVAVVFLTAHSDDQTVRRALETAPLGYLVKPVTERELRIHLPVALHKHALERRLRQSEERFETTLMSIADGVAATDVEGRIAFLNPIAAALTGWSQSEATGRPCGEVVRLVRGPGREPLPLPLARAAAEKPAPEHAETWLLARDGTAIPVEDSVAPIRDARGGLSGAVLVVRDIRARLEAAQRLARLEAHLQESQKMDSIGRLAGGVAHDVNNMMTVVAGYADLILRDETAPQDTRQMIEQIGIAAGRSADMTRQLLAFSRRQILQPCVMDLNDAIRGLAPMLRHAAGDAIAVEMRLESPLDPVFADPGQLDQVLLNLTTNARDAMPDGGLLAIETSRVVLDATDVQGMPELRPGAHVVLAVTDTGAGMEAAVRDRIFEPFFTTREMGEGVGLGLATVYGIVRQSGGHIAVDSAPGRGSLFQIYLPAVRAERP